MHRLIRIACPIFVFATLAACSPEQTDQQGSDELVAMTLQLESVSGALDTTDINYFRLRIYPTTPNTVDAATLFDSLKVEGCVPVRKPKSGLLPEVRIRDLKAGKDRFVYYEGFSDEQCSQRTALGIRGSVAIESQTELQKKAAAVPCQDDAACKAAIHPDAVCGCTKAQDADGKDTDTCEQGATGTCSVANPIFVPVYQTGAFNRFAMPSSSLQAAAAQVSCQDDSDCLVVHKRATCEQGTCRVMGLLPFSPERPRAFHEAFTAPDGRVTFVGGFTTIDGLNIFTAGAPFFEVFNPRSGMFERPGLNANFSGDAVAMARSAFVDGRLIATSGGVAQAKLKRTSGATGNALAIEFPFKTTDDDCSDEQCLNVSNQLVAAFLDTQDVMAFTLPGRVVGHRMAAVNIADSLTMILAGGLLYSDEMKTLSSTGLVGTCDGFALSQQTDPSCVRMEDGDMLAQRSSHHQVCLSPKEDGSCDDYLLFGGSSSEAIPAETLVVGGDLDTKALTFSKSVGALGKVNFPELVALPVQGGQGERFFSFGGTADVSLQTVETQAAVTVLIGAPNVPPQELDFAQVDTGKISTGKVDIDNLAGAVGVPEDVLRLFHSMVVEPPSLELPNGRIMMIGGLDDSVTPVDSVLVFEDLNAGQLEFRRKLKLNDARFGHTSSLITTGILQGAVLVVGGFTMDEASGGTVEFVDSAEIYIP